MEKKNHRLIFSIALVSAVTGGLVTIGNGCSGNFKSIESVGVIDAASTEALSSTGDGPFPIIPGAKTVSSVYSKQVLDQLMNCAGVKKVSDKTISMYESKKGAVSTLGSPETITSPMIMAVTSISGEICNDLINQEVSAPRIFVGIDLASTRLPAAADAKDAIRRLALSCWQRRETTNELQTVIDLANSGSNSRTSALLMCTAMLSSLDAILN
jgi:hypothetical protein